MSTAANNEPILDPRMYVIHEARGIILDFINSVYPLAMNADAIFGGMLKANEFQDRQTTQRDLAYLEGRGLIVKSDDPHPYKRDARITRYTLTPKGEHFVQLGKPWDRIESDF